MAVGFPRYEFRGSHILLGGLSFLVLAGALWVVSQMSKDGSFVAPHGTTTNDVGVPPTWPECNNLHQAKERLIEELAHTDDPVRKAEIRADIIRIDKKLVECDALYGRP